jgi:hypothetical protein
MWDTIVVALIVAAALAAAGRYLYRLLTGRQKGCGTCGTDCPACCHASHTDAPACECAPWEKR